MPDWLSDSLCRIATGGGYSARQLYSDAEPVVFEFTRPTIVTSIEELAVRGDLSDRTVAVNLSRIPDSARRSEAELSEEIERVRPLVLASILDAAVVGLQRMPVMKPPALPRLADFAIWVLACEPALPWRAGEFEAALAEQRKEAVETAIAADSFALALLRLLGERGGWEGTAAELLETLDAHLEDGRRPRRWPETPQQVGGRIARIAPLLRASGWVIERDRKGRGRERVISIYRNDYETIEREAIAEETWTPPDWLTEAEER